MHKILIVDDEILVQVGIQSLLSQTALNVQVCGTARNGQIALELIEELSPDIVITDIKMPVMDGLELARICQERYGSAGPGFIILTSYEDFQLAKKALTYQVSDYLIKLELTPEVLQESITRTLSQMHRTEEPEMDTGNTSYLFYDKFFISLLHNLFENNEQFTLQSRDLKLDFHYDGYVCCYGEIVSTQADALSRESQLSLFTSSLKMIRELVPKYMPCYALSLDMQHFALIFCYETLPPSCAPGESSPYFEEISHILTHVSAALNKYYSVSIQCGVGSLVSAPFAISDSYQYSRQAYQASSPIAPSPFLSSLRMPMLIIPLTSAYLRGNYARPLRNMTQIFCCGQLQASASCFPRTRNTLYRLWTLPAISCISPSPHCRTARQLSPKFTKALPTVIAPSTSRPRWSRW